jgi:hypothetical protein
MKFVYATKAHTFNGKAVEAKEFLFGGSDAGVSYDPTTQAVAILDRFPDFRTERCDDATPLDVDREVYKKMAIRAATGQEVADYDDAKKNKSALSDVEVKAMRAAMLVVRDYANALKDEVRGLAVLLVQKGTISAGEANALLAYDGDGAGDKKTIANLEADYIAAWKSLP